MMKIDKYALECDLAETYHIYDIYELPLQKVALFSYGLRENSRIKLKMSNLNYSLDTRLLAYMADKLAYLVWFKTKDGFKGINRPQSILSALLNEEEGNGGNNMSFDSPEAFEEYRNKILRGEI